LVPGGTGKKTAGSWCQGAQNDGLSNHKLKSALNKSASYDHNAHPSQTDGQTDRRTDEYHGNSA